MEKKKEIAERIHSPRFSFYAMACRDRDRAGFELFWTRIVLMKSRSARICVNKCNQQKKSMIQAARRPCLHNKRVTVSPLIRADPVHPPNPRQNCFGQNL